MKRKATFTLAGHRVTVDLEVRTVPADRLDFATLRPVGQDGAPLQSVSLQGTIKGPNGYSGGQCLGLLREIGAHVPDVARLCDLWDRWHMSDSHAGTKAQTEALAELRPAAGADRYTASLAFLTSRGLNPDTTTAPDFNDGKGYTYGTAWLAELAPHAVTDELSALLARLNGQKFGEAEGPREVEEIAEALGLTVESEFVPYSRSRSASDPERAKHGPNLNWRVRLMRAGRVILETDYSAGQAHAPAYNAPKGAFDRLHRPDHRAKAALVAWECEHGKAGRYPLYGGAPISRSPPSPILPNSGDVLAALMSEASVLDSGGFESWAADMGYDPDSRKAKAIFDACMDHALKLKAAIPGAAFEELRDAAHNR